MAGPNSVNVSPAAPGQQRNSGLKPDRASLGNDRRRPRPPPVPKSRAALASARRPAAGSYAAFASDLKSSKFAIAHLVRTSTASLWALIAISVSSLALLIAVS